MLERSANECDTALALDPQNYTFRSCAWAFMEQGKTQRALDYVRLDAGSEWAAYVLPSILLREGKVAEAREAVKHMPSNPRYHRTLWEGILQLRPSSELDHIAQDERRVREASTVDAAIWEEAGELEAGEEPAGESAGVQARELIAPLGADRRHQVTGATQLPSGVWSPRQDQRQVGLAV